MTTVLIAGANRGIGLEFTRQYLEDGAKVIATCRDPGSADALKTLEAGADGRLSIVAMDVADDASVAAAKKEIGEEPVDILINNAGVGGQRDVALGNVDFDDFERTLSVNTVAPYRVINAFIDNVKAGGEKKVVVVSSQLGSIENTVGFAVIYRTSKAAVNMVARTLAKELEQEGICVVPVHPGWVRTDMGGPKADLAPEESVAGLRDVIAGLSMEKSGHFYQWDGKELPW